MSRKSLSAVETEPVTEERPALDDRAALVAERVAARYANAPSYGALSGEMSQSVPAAIAASGSGIEAHVAMPYALTTPAATPLEVLSALAPSPLSQHQPEPADTEDTSSNTSSSFAGTEPEPEAQLKPRRSRRIARARRRALLSIQETEAAQPIPANLIQFPRPMIATRKKRPRRAEGPLAAPEPGTQLSIFEVEPETVSTEPILAVAGEPEGQAWLQPDWPGIELDTQAREDLLEEPPLAPPVVAIELAPLSRRVLSAVVDVALILTAFLAAALLAAYRVPELPGPRFIELSAGLAVLALSLAYLTFFLTVGTSTPGMRYAGIRLSTFSGSKPDRGQRCTRLAALILSVAPLGLGLLWALFDDAHLTWHDRLSRTYLRKL